MSGVNGAVGTPSLDRKSAEPVSGSEWDAEEDLEHVDYRDLENIDLDIECVNEALERKARRLS